VEHRERLFFPRKQKSGDRIHREVVADQNGRKEVDYPHRLYAGHTKQSFQDPWCHVPLKEIRSKTFGVGLVMSCSMPLTPEQPTEAFDVTALGIALDEGNQFAFLKDEELCEWK